MNQQTGFNKPKSSMTAVIIIIAVVFIVLVGGGILTMRYLGKKTVSNLTNALTTPASNTASSSISALAEWPVDLSAFIPKYSKGKILSAIKINSPKTWDVLIADTSNVEYDAYLSELKTAGWVSSANTQLLVDMNQFTKDNWDLTVVFDASSNGVKITLTEKVK